MNKLYTYINCFSLTFFVSKSVKCLFFLSIFALVSCSSDDECAYIGEDCEETCELYEDFEDETVSTPGNWLGIATSVVNIVVQNNSQKLYIRDGSGGTIAYNNTDFPANFLEVGCSLIYEVEYLSGSSNGNTTDNGFGIYSGATPTTATSRAFFILNSSNLITSGNPATTIEVPLELASGITLPSNSMGAWIVFPSSTAAADVATFNALIQNTSGIYFSIDEGANPAEQWWFDNFCFKQCCPNL